MHELIDQPTGVDAKTSSVRDISRPTQHFIVRVQS